MSPTDPEAPSLVVVSSVLCGPAQEMAERGRIFTGCLHCTSNSERKSKFCSFSLTERSAFDY